MLRAFAAASKMGKTSKVSLVFAIAFFLLSACQDSANVCNLRLVEVVSSDNNVACICENTPDGLGATTSRSFSIHIFEKSGGPTANNRVMIATNLDNSELVWKGSLVLEVVFERSRIYSFRNYWYPEKVTAQTEPIRIVLREQKKGERTSEELKNRVDIKEHPGRVENRIPHSVGQAYLLPPLSSGGASIAVP